MKATSSPQSVLLVVILVVASATLLPVAAQDGGPKSVVLDGDSERIASVDVDGTTYTVYRVDNAIPYASGIEVYAGGRRVTERSEVEPVIARLAARRTLEGLDTNVSTSTITSRSDAEEQFTVVAWQVAASDVGPEDVRQLERISDTANRIDRLVSPPLTAIDSILTLFDQMREAGLFGVTAWDLATNAYPQLPQYERALSEVRTELREWNSAAEQVTGNVDPAIASLERARQGRDVDYEQVSSQLEAAAEGLDQLQSKSDEVESSLSTASDEASELTDVLRETRVPEEFTRQLSRLAGDLDDAAAEVRSFSSTLEESSSQLSGVRTTARQEQQQLLEDWESERSSLRSQWRARKSAQTRVYGTFGGSSAGLVGVILLGRHLVL